MDKSFDILVQNIAPSLLMASMLLNIMSVCVIVFAFRQCNKLRKCLENALDILEWKEGAQQEAGEICRKALEKK